MSRYSIRLNRIPRIGISSDIDTRYRHPTPTVAVSGCRYRMTVSKTDTVIQLPIPTFGCRYRVLLVSGTIWNLNSTRYRYHYRYRYSIPVSEWAKPTDKASKSNSARVESRSFTRTLPKSMMQPLPRLDASDLPQSPRYHTAVLIILASW